MSANGNGICTSSMCGDCAADSECQTAYSASSFCFSGSCEVCDAVGTDYIVDPVNGNDATATGSGTAGGGKTAGRCAFKTVTAAIKAINGNPGGAKLTITVLGASTLTGETYPLVIPQQTTLTTSGGDVQVTPAGDISNIFTLGVPGASIDGGANIINLVGSGLTGASNRGINVVSGCDDACIIRQFHVTDTGGAAVSVGGTGRATMLEGVQINKVGRGNNTRNCVLVGDGAAFLTIKVAAGQAQTIVNNCSGVGIGVYVNAGLAVAGEVDFTQPDKSSIVVANSGSPGLVIQQAINGSTPQLCTIDGLATVLNGLQPASQFGASGMRLQLGSNVRVRNSASVANKNHGVHVVAAAGGPAIGTLSIDLGNAASPGLNVFQATGVPNAGVGICFSPGTGALKLPAQGNTFFAADCSMTNASLTHSDGPNGCSGAHDVGVNSGAVGTAIDVSMCN